MDETYYQFLNGESYTAQSYWESFAAEFQICAIYEQCNIQRQWNYKLFIFDVTVLIGGVNMKDSIILFSLLVGPKVRKTKRVTLDA